MKRPKLMAIVNLSQDSFSGDGVGVDAALAYAKEQMEQGADILDIGAESTRPGAVMLTAEQEWKRLAPFLGALQETVWGRSVTISIDSYHPENVARLHDWGVTIVNDVRGLSDPAMAALLAKDSGDVIVMHSLTIPADKMVTLPVEADPVTEILRWKKSLTKRLADEGMNTDRLIFDPGLGFGKTPEQSLKLILGIEQLMRSGGRWLIGHSRKSFLTLFGDIPAPDRDGLTLAFSAMLAQAGVDYLRVHNVAAHVRLLERLCM